MVRMHYQHNGHESEQSPREWRTGKPVVLKSKGWQRVGHDLVTEQQQYPKYLMHKYGTEMPYIYVCVCVFIKYQYI